MPAPAEVQKKTIDAFLDGWAEWTPEAFLSTWSDDCTQQTLPYSHNVPKRDRANTNHLFPILMSIMDNLQVSRPSFDLPALVADISVFLLPNS